MAESTRDRILITHRLVPDVAKEILGKDFDVVMPESVPPRRDEILQLSNGVIGILWASHEPLNAEALDAAGPKLKSISTMSAGIDYVDVDEVKRRNISLGYTPGVLNDAVADLAIGLMIATARRFHEGSLKIRQSEWKSHPQWLLGRDIKGSTVGIIGLGGIGSKIAKRLQGFDVGHVLYTGRKRKPEDIEKTAKAKFTPIDELLAKSDFIFICVPLTNSTRAMIDATAFSKMKSTAVLVNVARGEVVNQADLYEALKTKRIYGAGLDVMYPEPLDKDDPLLKLENIVISPHVGSATERTRYDMANIAALNVLAGIAGERLFSPVP